MTGGKASYRYWLNHDVFCSDVGDGLVLLDLRRNRYLGLPESQTVMLSGLVADWPLRRTVDTSDDYDAERDRLANALVRNGVLSHTKCGSGVIERPPAAVDALRSIDLRTARTRIPSIAYARFAFALVRSRFVFSCCTLRGVIAHLRKQSSKADGLREPTRHRLAELMGHFVILRAFTYTAKDRCVLDCLVLSEFLRLHAVKSTFVIGVTTRPFQAHCWIQVGGTMMNDEVESAAYHVPILSV
jgi:hypothetical protein